LSSHKVSVYKVHSKLSFQSEKYDIAVLRMCGNGPYPPAFETFDSTHENQKELPIYNVGYQFDDNKPYPVLVADKSVVLKTPSEEKLQGLNKFMKEKYNDKTGYSGLLREGNICQWSSIVGGGSGGLSVHLVTESVKVIGMYQNGYPMSFYRDQSFSEREIFNPHLKVESGISIAKLLSIFPQEVKNVIVDRFAER